ncbi:MAG: AIR synthase family protein [Armatimonadota bacterium]
MWPRLPIGKLDLDLLRRLLADYQREDPRVILGPTIGEDVAVIEMGRTCLVAKTDPITFATDEIGWYAVQVNANDVATSGAVPRWFMATILLPDNSATEGLAEDIFKQIADACEGLDVTLVGGHTEVTYDLQRPIIVGTMLGEVAREHLICTAGAQIGDQILLTKGVALEGTAILAREKPDFLRQLGRGEDEIRALRDLLRDPGISVVRDAQIACEAGHVHAMHDPTEGGVATGLWELALAADIGLRIDGAELDEMNPHGQIWRELDIDPLGVIGSGALLITAADSHARAIRWKLVEAGIRCRIIGRATAASDGLILDTPQGPVELPRYDQDEITKLFS